MVEIRKLVKSGATSHTISLPKVWLDKHKLQKGDILYLHQKDTGELSIYPKLANESRTKKELTLNIENKDYNQIKREITSAYINNYYIITLLDKSLSKRIKDLRQILHDFVALEISEQTQSKLIIKDLLNLSEISVDKTIRRMDNTVRTVLIDTLNCFEDYNYNAVYYRDFDVNKLHFLLYRILKSAMSDSKIASDFNLTQTETLIYWYLSMTLEAISDISKYFAELLKNNSSSDLKQSFEILTSYYYDSMKCFYNKDLKFASDLVGRRSELYSELIKLNTLDKNNYLQLYNLFDLLNEIVKIPRTVMDNYSA